MNGYGLKERGSNMKGLIIAAGRGSRLSGKGDIKPLVQLCGVPIIERVIDRASKGGISGFVIVTGYRSETLTSYLNDLALQKNITIELLFNDMWARGNGISVLRAKSLLGENFILLMSDHLFDPSTLTDLMKSNIHEGQVVLAVDHNIENNEYVDLDDVTRVLEEEGQIKAIGKHLDSFNAFDTGMFLCTPSLFEALEESLGFTGNESLSGGMEILSRKGCARTFDIGGRFWIDIDDDEMFHRAEKILIMEEGCRQ